MMMMRTAHSLIGVVTLALLLAAFRGALRVALNGVDDPSLLLAIPVLVLAACLTALTSAATALTLEILALILIGLRIAADGADWVLWAGAVGLLLMAGLCGALLRGLPGSGD